MTAKSHNEFHNLFNPLLQVNEVSQTLLSDLWTNQSQFLISSINQVIGQTEQLLSVSDPQSFFDAQQAQLEKHRYEFADLSEHLTSSFQKAHASYQNIFISAVQANDNLVPAEQETTATKKKTIKKISAPKSSASEQPASGKAKQKPATPTKAATAKTTKTTKTAEATKGSTKKTAKTTKATVTATKPASSAKAKSPKSQATKTDKTVVNVAKSVVSQQQQAKTNIPSPAVKMASTKSPQVAKTVTVAKTTKTPETKA